MPKCVRTAHVFEKKWRSDDVRLQEEADFSSLLLSNKVLLGLENAGYKKPSPIQLEAVPVGLFGRDLLVQAKSGTGKTLVFTIIALETLLEVKHPQVLILAPAREIAVQIRDVFRAVGSEFSNLKCNSFIGGTPLEEDLENVLGCQIIVGTPGRLKHLISIGILPTNSIRLIVLDEADILLSEAFKIDLDFIFQSLPKDKQVIAASATFPKELKYFIQHYFRDVFMARLNRKELTLLGMIHYIYLLQLNKMPLLAYKAKLSALEKVLSSIQFTQCLVFCNLISRVESLCFDIRNWGFTAAYISSAKEQCDRLRAIDYLKRFKCKILVSSDVTSRGIDAENVDLVINFDHPYNSEVYLHRCGRAGRYGSKGVAITFLTEDEIERFEKLKTDENFEAYNLPDPVPLNLINLRPKHCDALKRKEEISSEDEMSENESVDVISSSHGIGSIGKMISEKEDEPIPSEVDTFNMDEAVLNETFPTGSIKNCRRRKSPKSLLEESPSPDQDECIKNDISLSKDSIIEIDTFYNPVSAGSENNAAKNLQCDNNVKDTIINGSSEELLVKDKVVTYPIEVDNLEIHETQSDIQNGKEQNVIQHSNTYSEELPLEIKIDEENRESNLSLLVSGPTVSENGQETCADFDYSVDTKESIQNAVKCHEPVGDNSVGSALDPVTLDNLCISDCNPSDQKKDTKKSDVSDHQPVSESVQYDNRSSASSHKNCIKKHFKPHKEMNKLNASCNHIQKGSLHTPNKSSNSAVETVDISYLNKLQIPIVKFLMDCEKHKTNCSADSLHGSESLINKTDCEEEGTQKTSEEKSLLSDLTITEKYKNIRKGLNDFYCEVFKAYQTECIEETTFEDLKRIVMSKNDIKISKSVEENTKQMGGNDNFCEVKNHIDQNGVPNKPCGSLEEKCIPSLKSSFNSKKRNYPTDSSDSDDSSSLSKSEVLQSTPNEDQAFAKYIFNGKRASQSSSSSSDESLKRKPYNKVKEVSGACSKSSEVSLSSISSSESQSGSHHSISRGSIRKQKMFSSRECYVSKVPAPKQTNLCNLSENGLNSLPGMQKSYCDINCVGEKQLGARRKVFQSEKQSVVKKFNFKQPDSESDSSDTSDQYHRRDTRNQTVFNKRQNCIKTKTRNRKPSGNVMPINSSTPYSPEFQQNGSSPNYASDFQKARSARGQRERSAKYGSENVAHSNFCDDYYSPFCPHIRQRRAFPAYVTANQVTSLNTQCSDRQCHRHSQNSSCGNDSCADWYRIFLKQWGFIHAYTYPHHR